MFLTYAIPTAIYLGSAYLLLNNSKSYSYVETEPFQLLVGFTGLFKKPLLVDMSSTPHLLITGLSGQGKSRMAKTMLLNARGADIIICNAFKRDYKCVQARFINGEVNILNYLKSVLEEPYIRNKTLYIVLEEMMSLKNKELQNCIKELLCISRHYNIYVIGIIQIATKEECKFKSYFNARLTFKQVDDSAYRVALGTGIDRKLKQQEFALLTDDLYYGRTYDID